MSNSLPIWLRTGPTEDERRIAERADDMTTLKPFSLSVDDMRRAHFYAQQLRIIQDALASNVISAKTYELARKTQTRLTAWFNDAHLVIDAANKLVQEWPARPVDEDTQEAMELERWGKSLEGEFWSIVFFNPDSVSRDEKIRMARVALYINDYAPDYPDDDALVAHWAKFATAYHPGFARKVAYYEEKVAKHKGKSR